MKTVLPAAILSLSLFVTNVQGTLITFDASWVDPLGGPIRLDAVIVIDDAILPNPTPVRTIFSEPPSQPESGIVSIEMMLGPTPHRDGTLTETDFTRFFWSTNGGALDLTRELVGQPTANLPWGTSTASPSPGLQFLAGDFSLASSLSRNGLPQAVSPFQLATNIPGSGGVNVVLTNFTPRTVPEPSLYVMEFAVVLYGLLWRKRLNSVV